jgi:hypothetical protein
LEPNVSTLNLVTLSVEWKIRRPKVSYFDPFIQIK